MTVKLYIVCLIAGLLGQIFQMIVKIIALRKRSTVANAKFSIKQYLIDDSLPLVLNVLALFIYLFVLDEVIKLRPSIMEYIKFTFVAFGYMGSSLLSAALSKAEEKINQVVDRKTDIADGK